MKLNEGRRVITHLFDESLTKLGFSHAGALSFSRQSVDAIQLISFSCRQNRMREGICFSFGAGVRFDAVEDLLGVDPEQRLFPTISKPLSVLKSASGYPEWCLNEDTDLSVVRLEVVHDIESYALPFLDRYSTLDSVCSQLSKEDPRQWFVLDPEQRIATLSAITHVKGDTAGALRILDEALQERSNAPEKLRFRLEKLRARLVV